MILTIFHLLLIAMKKCSIHSHLRVFIHSFSKYWQSSHLVSDTLWHLLRTHERAMKVKFSCSLHLYLSWRWETEKWTVIRYTDRCQMVLSAMEKITKRVMGAVFMRAKKPLWESDVKASPGWHKGKSPGPSKSENNFLGPEVGRCLECWGNSSQARQWEWRKSNHRRPC